MTLHLVGDETASAGDNPLCPPDPSWDGRPGFDGLAHIGPDVWGACWLPCPVGDCLEWAEAWTEMTTVGDERRRLVVRPPCHRCRHAQPLLQTVVALPEWFQGMTWLPCPVPGCLEWTYVYHRWSRAKGRLLVRRPCRRCRVDMERAQGGDAPIAPQPLEGKLWTDPQGRNFYRSPPPSRSAEERIRLPAEYWGLSIDKIEDRTGQDGKRRSRIRRDRRKPGVTYVENLRVKACLAALTDLVEGKIRQSFLLHGEVGTGKTHLAALVALAFARRAKPVFWFQESLWNGFRLSTFEDEREKATTILRQAEEAELLVWDELAYCPGQETRLNYEILRDLTRLAIQRREARRLTIWTSNASVVGLETRLGESLVSRIKGDCGSQIWWFGATGEKDRTDWRDWRQLPFNGPAAEVKPPERTL